MKAYSEDLRRKIVDALKLGMPKSEAASLFGVSLSSVKRFARMDCQGDSLAPRKPPGRPPRAAMPPGGCSKRTSPIARPPPPQKGDATWSV
jgi:transposase